jgi:glycine betaine transporter
MSYRTDLIESFHNEVQPAVFWGGAILTVIAIGFIAARPEAAATVLTAVNTWLWKQLGWVYLWSVFLAVVFCLWLLIGPWGRIKLGGPDEDPEFSLWEFFAMLFSAGLSTGLVFFGPAEALLHYASGPPLLEAGAKSAEIMPGALRYTFLHWGLSPWSAYLIVGITIGYYAHRKDAPIKPSTIFAPLIGVENLKKDWVKPLDIGIVLVSVGGVAVSLGFVITQFLTGLNYNWGVQVGDVGTLLLTMVITVAFTVSAALGVKRGIRLVSNFNMYLFFILMTVLFIFGPTAILLGLGTQAFGTYVTEFIHMSLYTGIAASSGWVGAWTIFYWGWWLSFAPMIGIFIARICRGRTIRQIVFAGLIGSSAASFAWFTITGGSSLWAQNTGRVDILGIINKYGTEVAGFPLFEYLIPFGDVFAALYLLLVMSFLITTIDSTTLSLAMFTTGGGENPSTINRVVWGMLVGLLSSLLLITGGLPALKDLVVLLGFPIAILVVICFVGLIVEFEQQYPVLLTERDRQDEDDKAGERESDSLIGYVTEWRSGSSND